MFFMRSDELTGSLRDDRPTVRVLPATGPMTAVVVMLHGGRSRGHQPTTTRQLAYRRMVPIAHSVHSSVHRTGTAIWLLRNRVRGWNEPDQDAVRDARWVLGELRRHHPEAAIVLVGHSMGGRAALRVADAPGVLAVCALAPWIEPDEPIGQLTGRTVLIAHAARDRRTDPDASYAYAQRARRANVRVCRFEVRHAGHAMVRRATDWSGLVRAFVTGAVGAAPPHPAILAALGAPAPEGLRRPLPAGVW
jgi:dienelactone hydrolase